MVQVKFIIKFKFIYVIHKISVLFKINRIFRLFLRSIISSYLFIFSIQLFLLQYTMMKSSGLEKKLKK